MDCYPTVNRTFGTSAELLTIQSTKAIKVDDQMTWEIPNRDTWTRIDASRGSWREREWWCRENCAQRYIQLSGSRLMEFESHKDAVAFALRWA